MRLSGEDTLVSAHEDSGRSEMRQMSQTTLVDPSIIRPKVYYNDGPFDAPSSSDEEGESLLGEDREILDPPTSPGMAELGGSSPRATRKTHLQNNALSLRFLIFGIAALVGLACLIGIFAAMAYTAPESHSYGQRITMDHIFNGTFSPVRSSVNWVPEAGDGVFSTSSGSVIKLVDLKTNTTKDLVNFSDIKDEHNNPLGFSSWQVSPDMKYILVKADYRKQWRWSSFGNYYVHHIESRQTHPIVPPSNPSRTAYATWSPTGQAIAYVLDNDLYILPSASPSTQAIRVTTTGNASLFHGVPDWVYEEEVFSGDFALWWSPDSKKVAFLSLDETLVPEYNFPIYNPTDDAHNVVPYTTDIVMKYPKPGYPNPLVSVNVFDLERYLDENDIDDDDLSAPLPPVNTTLTLDWEGRHPPTDSVVFDVTWVGNASLIVKELNRNGNDGNVVTFDLEAPTARERTRGELVRKLGKDGEHGDEGWVENEQTIYPLLKTESTVLAGASGYLDITPTPEGYNHIALFSPTDSKTPHFLTSGEWEVTGGILSVDIKKGLVYFQAAKTSSTERHIYSVPLPDLSKGAKAAEPVALTDDSKAGFFRASFSPQAGFYLLSYDGPDVPWQKVIKVDDSKFEYVLTTNEELKNITEQYEAPTVIYSTFTNDGYEFNAKEIRPPRMDDSGRMKYPVLFKVYGGPASQQVDQRFARSDWYNYIACGLKTIVVIVDGRGTGFKGRKLRNPVKGNLGFFETIDQIEAARAWAKKPYVDSKRIGIWGWSYGGFMSSKVAEANAGVHSLAMAVAPVTSWALYDSIYTERYMNTPQLNPGGYVNASITNVTGFNNIDYLLAHGSGDDNVHYANTAHLLDMFTQEKIRNFRFRMFTDSDHSISRRGGSREVYEFLTSFLQEKWGVGPRRRV